MNKIFEHTIVTIFKAIILTYALGAQKNHLIETVFEHHQPMFWMRNKHSKPKA